MEVNEGLCNINGWLVYNKFEIKKKKNCFCFEIYISVFILFQVEEFLELKVEEIEDDGINWIENCFEVEEDEIGKSDKELDGRTSDDEEFLKEMLYKYFENLEDIVFSEENNMDEDNLGIENERNFQ